jgi:uncharacterized protein (TIGR02147 family)
MTIFQHSNYKKYLREYIEQLPRQGRGQINRLAEHLGVNSTLISQVLNGPKDFTLEQGILVTEYLGLPNLEAEYFLLLIQIERAGIAKLKDHFRAKAAAAKAASMEVKNRVSTDGVLSDQDRAVFYSSWIYSAVRLYCSLGEGKSFDEICQRFELDRTRALSILEFLLKANLCKHEGTLYKIGMQKIHLEQGSPYLGRHYSNWRLRAIQRGENLSKDELMFTAPFSIHPKDFAQLREEMLELIQKLYKRVGETDPEEIACVNIDLFWIQ